MTALDIAAQIAPDQAARERHPAHPAHRVARALVLLAPLWLLGRYGGKGDFTRDVAIGMIALGLAATIMIRAGRAPRLAWILPAFLPLVALCALQCLPIGWHHPWMTDDLALLGRGAWAGAWSLDPEATRSSGLWILSLGALALAACRAFAGERVRVLARVLVACAGVHAACALVLAQVAPDFPSASAGIGRVRGTFVSANQAAGFWGAMLPLALLLTARDHRRWGFAAVAIALALVLSASRGGIITAMIIDLPLAWWLLPRHRRWWWAAGGTAVVGAWLLALNLSSVAARFADLGHGDAETFSNRTVIWRAALPLISQASPIGTGADTTTLAWRRSGEAYFEPSPVAHLHSDPLEALLEFGWAGTLLVVMGAAASLRLIRRGSSDRGATLVIGPMLGIAHLLLHGCAEFLWSSECIAAFAVLLLVILAQGSATGPRATAPPASPAIDHGPAAAGASVGPAGAACGVLAVILVALSPHDWRFARQEAAFVSTSHRLADPAFDPASDAPDAAIMDPAAMLSARYASVRARLALDAADAIDGAADDGAGVEAGSGVLARRAALLVAAHEALDRAARLCPAEPRAWLERARLRMADLALDGSRPTPAATRTVPGGTPEDRPDRSAASAGVPTIASLRRALAWGPGWEYGRSAVWRVLGARDSAGAISENDRSSLVRELLACDRAQQSAAFAVAADAIGEPALEELLASSRSRLRASAAPWLAAKGSLGAWLEARRCAGRLANSVTTSAQWLAAEEVFPEGGCEVRVAGSPPARRQEAASLMDAGLPIPEALGRALRQDGAPWSSWAAHPDLRDGSVRAEFRHSLGPFAAQAWAREWLSRVAVAESIADGRTTSLAAATDPGLIAQAIAMLDRPVDQAKPAGGEAERLTLLLSPLRRADWHELSGAHWSWVFVDDRTPPLAVSSMAWIAVAVDGAFVTWSRGVLDARALLTPGLHRVALISPP